MKKILDIINNLLTKLVSGFYELLQWFTIIKTILLSIVFILIGQIINFYQPFGNFHIYQILVISSIIIASWAVNKFKSEIKLFNEMTASHPIKFAGMKVIKLIYSKWVLLALVIVGGLYTYAAISLNYVEFNLIGIYALIMIVLMLGSAIFGQTVYVYYIILLISINRQSEFKYNFYIPAKTNWVVKLAKNGRMLNNSFFVLGFIYTLVYYLNVPQGAMKIIDVSTKGNIWDKFQFSTPDNFIFIISWIIIFIIIVVAFPVYYYVQNTYIKSLVRNLKDLSIFEIQKFMKAKELSVNDNIELELKYFTLINNVENSPSKPLSSYNVIPILSSIGSISVHFIKISESLL